MRCYHVRFDGDERDFACQAEQSVLAALAPVHNDRIAAGCHGGGCGICKVVIHEGDYVCKKMSRAHVSIDEEGRRVVLACQTFPRSDLRIEPFGQWSRRLAQAGSERDRTSRAATRLDGRGEMK